MDDLLQKHIDGLKKLVAEGFCVGDFNLTVHLKRGGEDVEFTIKPPSKWTLGAGVVAPNRNCYHHAEDPYEAYHNHAKDKATKAKKGKKHEEAAEMLVKVLDSLAAKAHVVMKKKQPYMAKQKTKQVDAKKGYTIWTVHIADQHWRNVRVFHCPVKNKFKFDCQAHGFLKKSDKSWVIPMTFLEKMGARPEFAKILADPTTGGN